MTTMDHDEALYLKIRLLLEGAVIPEGFSRGRKGGAGPVGGRYFMLPNGSLCGIPIRTSEQARIFNSSNLEPLEDDKWRYDSKYIVTEIPTPEIYQHSTKDGIDYGKIALLHGTECLATTVFQSCKYWSTGDQCKFCTIPTSFLSGNTIKEKTPEQIAEVVKQGLKDGIIKHVLLTTGTSEGEDMGIERLVSIAEAIREFSNIPIAVQFEPPEDTSYLKKLADVGVNAVGIHLESADEKIRSEMCPGKYRYGSFELYNRTWDAARKYFKKGDVSTFLLFGLGENLEQTIDLCEYLAQKGILPVVTPFRPAPGSQLADFVPHYVGRLDESVEFYKKLGTILFKHGLDPKSTSAGCSRCGGCTPMQDAYNWASHQ